MCSFSWSTTGSTCTCIGYLSCHNKFMIRSTCTCIVVLSCHSEVIISDKLQTSNHLNILSKIGGIWHET